MPATKWTKKAIEALCTQLSSWWCFNALYLEPGVKTEDVWDTMPLEVRIKIVIGGLRNFHALLSERAAKYRETAAHYAGVWADTGRPRDLDGELQTRFSTGAAEADKDAAIVQKLIDRVDAEGLPPEVVTWRPER